jgi:hypothetical protein
MPHAFMTVAIPFDAERVESVEAALRGWKNPARRRLARALRRAGTIHFMSASVVGDGPRRPAHLVLEISADGAPEDTARRIVSALEKQLLDVLALAGVQLGNISLGVCCRDRWAGCLRVS